MRANKRLHATVLLFSATLRENQGHDRSAAAQPASCAWLPEPGGEAGSPANRASRPT